MSQASTSASFDRLTSIAATLVAAPAATVAIKAPDGLFLHGGPGMSDPGLTRGANFTEIALEMGAGGVLVVEDASKDPRFRDIPVVAGAPHVRFFAGAVITLKDGTDVGTLLVVDDVARPRPDDAQLDALKVLAAMAADILDRDAEASRQRDELSMLGLAEAMSGVGHWRRDVATQSVHW